MCEELNPEYTGVVVDKSFVCFSKSDLSIKKSVQYGGNIVI